MTLIRKLRTFLAKQVSQGVMYSFLGLIAPGNHPFLPRAAPPSVIVSGLSQAGKVRQPRDRRLLADRIRAQAMSKLRGEGPSPPFSIAPKSFLRAPLSPCLS